MPLESDAPVRRYTAGVEGTGLKPSDCSAAPVSIKNDPQRHDSLRPFPHSSSRLGAESQQIGLRKETKFQHLLSQSSPRPRACVKSLYRELHSGDQPPGVFEGFGCEGESK